MSLRIEVRPYYDEFGDRTFNIYESSDKWYAHEQYIREDLYWHMIHRWQDSFRSINSNTEVFAKFMTALAMMGFEI